MGLSGRLDHAAGSAWHGRGTSGVSRLEAERRILASTVLTGTGLEGLGLLDGAGRPTGASAVWLSGLDSMRLTTEELPRLAERSDITVEVTGEPADYREAGESLRIAVSTTERARRQRLVRPRRDHHRGGRARCRSADVFLALAGGEPHLLLPTAPTSPWTSPSCRRWPG